MEEHITPSIDPPRLAVNNCCRPGPWDPTCSGRPVAPPARISFPDLEQSFPRLERYLHKLRQKKKGAPRIGLEQFLRQFPERLVTQSHFEQILQRLGVEKVRQHWNWWILPVATGGAQGCGSSTSRKFALESLYEAIAFLCHPELGKSFFWSIQWIRDQVEPQGRRGGRGRTLNEIFGETDAKKVRCSVTLFRRLAGWCYSLSPASYATLIANCDAILVAASRDGHRSCDHVPELYRQFEESLEDPRERAKMQEMFPVKCVHCDDPVWPPDHNWGFVHKWCVEENALTWNPFQRAVRDFNDPYWGKLSLSERAMTDGYDYFREAPKRFAAPLFLLKNPMDSGDWDGSPPVRHESQKSPQDWLQNLAPEDDVPLGDLGFDPTLVSFLEGNDIRGVAQLVSHTEEELMAIRSLGSGKATKIRDGLERFGWRLGEVSSFSEGRRRLRSALADQAQEAEYEQREAKDLVWPLVSNGSSVDRIVESTGLSEAAVREARNAWMVEQRIAGASNRTIGETVGMSAEAVRRSIKRADNLDSGHIRELRAARLEGSIRDTVTSMPGSSLDEIAEKAGISRNDVRRNLTRLGTKLVWDVNRRNRSRVKKWSDEQLLQALQTASTGSTPLTVTAYDELVTRGDIKGPTGQVFFLRFGSWRKACEAAGVQCGESARDYTRKSVTDLEALVVEFLFSSEHDGSFVEFQRWLDERPEYPSMATIRNRLGQWGSMKQKAIEEVVAAGRFAELCDLCD
jgi:uncharacterized protein (DUF1810 family)